MHRFGKIVICSMLLVGCWISAPGCQYFKVFPSKGPTSSTQDLTVEPGKNFHRIPPYIFLADFDLDPNLPLFRELASLRDQITSELHLPTADKTIKVFLFENRSKYENYMDSRFPNLPKRRAFFVAMPRGFGGPEELLVYTYWGSRIQQDLRHELTHALLHSVLLDVPLWLDEGLAEYFENPQGWSGINYKHLDQIQQSKKGPFLPNMDRLETLKKVHEMSPAEYRESWAWAHFLLRGHPKAKTVLLSYLAELRTNPKPGPLRPRLQAAIPDLDQALLLHLKKLHNTKPTIDTSPLD